MAAEDCSDLYAIKPFSLAIARWRGSVAAAAPTGISRRREVPEFSRRFGQCLAPGNADIGPHMLIHAGELPSRAGGTNHGAKDTPDRAEGKAASPLLRYT